MRSAAACIPWDLPWEGKAAPESLIVLPEAFYRLPALWEALGRSRAWHSSGAPLNTCPLVKTMLLDNSACCGPGAEIVLEVTLFTP